MKKENNGFVACIVHTKNKKDVIYLLDKLDSFDREHGAINYDDNLIIADEFGNYGTDELCQKSFYLDANYVDCGEDIDMFCAISAIRNNTDKDQWFVSKHWVDGNNIKIADKWVLCTQDSLEKFGMINNSPNTYNRQKGNLFKWKKASVEDIIIYFKIILKLKIIIENFKVKGKCIYNNRWVYGDLLNENGDTKIGIYREINDKNKDSYYKEIVKVDKNTVKKFSGLLDKNKIEIYTGYTVRIGKSGSSDFIDRQVIFEEDCFGYKSGTEIIPLELYQEEDIEIIDFDEKIDI